VKKISKSELIELVDEHFYTDFNAESYTVQNINAVDLLTSHRFDLVFKLLYLEMKDRDIEFAKELYIEHIKAFTLGTFNEPGNDEKNSIERFIEVFDNIFEEIKNKGFDASKSLIPLSKNGSIANGAHRVASSIFLEKKVPCVSLNGYDHLYDYDFFYKRNIDQNSLDTVVTKFVEYASNIYIAFIWPTAVGNDNKIEEIIPNVVYKKEIRLNVNGAHNLLSKLYFGEDWLGSVEDNFKGTRGKLVECFKTFDPVRVIAFQAESLDEVLHIKEKIRDIFKVGKHAVHITDTKEEAIQTARLVFNDNSVHFLNHAKPNKYASTHKKIDDFKLFMKENNLDSKDLLLDSSIILSAYGLREANDTDYLCSDNSKIESNFNDINMHDEVLKYYDKKKNEMIYNPKFYFYFNDVKFISFSQLYKMKTKRDEKKDKNDCKMMEALIEEDKLKVFISQFKQTLYYQQIKFRQNTVFLLQKLGLFEMTRTVYRKLKGRR
jgi:hypothetical protein